MACKWSETFHMQINMLNQSGWEGSWFVTVVACQGHLTDMWQRGFRKPLLARSVLHHIYLIAVSCLHLRLIVFPLYLTIIAFVDMPR